MVLHSTHAFSEGAAGVFGATSSAARIGGAVTEEEREREVLEQLVAAAEERLSPRWLSATHIRATSWGPHLHRWGGAFPAGPFLPAADAFAPSARVAFCGDFVDVGAPTASIEGAVLSGLATAASLQAALLPPASSL